MMRHIVNQKYSWLAGTAVLALALGLAAGCKKQQPAEQPVVRTDQQVASDIQAKINGETALAGQNIQASVANGVATLSGTVTDEASRALAGNDSGTVKGVTTVVNNLTVQPAQRVQAAPPQAPVQEKKAKHERLREEQAYVAPRPAPEPYVQPAPVRAPAPLPPPEPPKPVVKQIVLEAGTVVRVRLTETLDSKTTAPNQAFHGSLAGDLMAQGVVAIPHGSPVLGRVVDARDAAHFKGSSLLSLELTELTARGQKITLVTDTYSKEGAGRGKNTAAKVGGGSAFGAIVGALAGGGKGAVIGGLAGAGAGAGVNAATRGQQVEIPTETLVDFRLQSPITVTVTLHPSGSTQNDQNGEPLLQRR